MRCRRHVLRNVNGHAHDDAVLAPVHDVTSPATRASLSRTGLSPVSIKAAPEKGVAAPEKGVTAPEKGVAAPEKGVTAPEKGVAAPEKGVAAPEKGVAAPEKGVAAPEKGVAASEKGVAATNVLSRSEVSRVKGVLGFDLTLAPPRPTDLLDAHGTVVTSS